MTTPLPYYFPPALPAHLHTTHRNLVAYILIRSRCPKVLGEMRKAIQEHPSYWANALKAEEVREYTHWVEHNLWLPPTGRLQESSFAVHDEVAIASKARIDIRPATATALYYATKILHKRNKLLEYDKAYGTIYS